MWGTCQIATENKNNYPIKDSVRGSRHQKVSLCICTSEHSDIFPTPWFKNVSIFCQGYYWGAATLDNPYCVQVQCTSLALVGRGVPRYGTVAHARAQARVCNVDMKYNKAPDCVLRPKFETVNLAVFFLFVGVLPCDSVDVGAWCSNTAKFSTAQTGSHAPKQQYNIQIFFKIKHSMLTPAHTSQERDKYY